MKLFVFCGPSGSGKTTIVQHLLKHHDKLSFSVSATTRSMRPNETDGVDYYFLSPEAFREKIMHDEFLEWEEVYKDRYYGSLKSEVERIYKSGKYALFDVDVEGGLKIKSIYGDNVMAVFVRPPSLEVLHERLINRQTESAESLKKRIEKSNYEWTFANRFDKVIINDTLDEAFKEAMKLVDEFIK